MIHFLLAFLMGVYAHALTHSAPALSADFESNILIMSNGPTEDGGIAGGFCNATLVTNQVMVTAAHCIKDAYVLKDMNLKLFVGAYKYIVRPNGETVRVGYADYIKGEFPGAFYFNAKVTQEIANKGFKTVISPADDTAVVILERPLILKEGFKFAEMVSRDELSQVVSSVLRFTPTVVTINPLEEITTTDTKKMALLNDLNFKRGYWTSKSNSRTKPGDSGAPVFINVSNQWKMVANVKGEVHSLLSSEDLYTLSSTNLCQISEKINDTQIRKKLCP